MIGKRREQKTDRRGERMKRDGEMTGRSVGGKRKMTREKEC